MKEIVFLLEESSAKAMIEIVIQKLFNQSATVRFIVFDGKQDLEKNLMRKIRAYINPQALFVVMRDQDSGDCQVIKNNLRSKCEEAGKSNAVVRIVCRELESWYLADLNAVEKAFPQYKLSDKQKRKKFRNPDLIGNPCKELKKLVPEYQKINGSRMIAQFLDIENTRSRSYYHFIKTLKTFI